MAALRSVRTVLAMYAWHDTPWMWLTMVVFWVLLAVAVYYVLSGPRGPTLPRRGPRAIEILEERYARGELSAEEYHERRQTLDGLTDGR